MRSVLCSSSASSLIGTESRQGVNEEFVNIPSSFICPITGEVMVDPMIIVGSRQTVSRAAARQWFSMGHFRCPVTNINLESIRMIPNRSLCAAIKEFNESRNKAMQKSFICPVTGTVMRDAVVIVQSMVTISRSAAIDWQRSDKPACPVTGKILKNRDVITNFALNGAIEEWESSGWELPQQGIAGLQYYRKLEDEDDLSTFEKCCDSKTYDQNKEDGSRAFWRFFAFAALAVHATKRKSFELVVKSILAPTEDTIHDGLPQEIDEVETCHHGNLRNEFPKQAEQSMFVHNEFSTSTESSFINEAEGPTVPQTSQEHDFSFLSLLKKDSHMISDTSLKEGSTLTASASSHRAASWDIFLAAIKILMQYIEFIVQYRIH